MAKIFISHSSRDNDASTRMKAWLEDKGFTQTFLDIDKHSGIPPGADWERTLYSKIESSQAVILILTPNWFASKWCFAEFTQARALGKSIFPVIESPSEESFVAPDIQHLDLLKDREGGLDRLQRALTEVALNAQGVFDLPAGRAPYPGLAAFDEEDAAIYFGRDDEIRRMIELLRSSRTHGQPRLIALLGASGSGKSSLLRAGVLPRLKRDGAAWVVVPPFRPSHRPIRALARALASALGAPEQVDALEQGLNTDPSAILETTAERLRIQAERLEATILISVDQAEEMFSLADPKARAVFLKAIDALSAESGPFVTLMTMRSEFLDPLQRTQRRFEEASLGPLPLTRVRQIVEGPAEVTGLELEAGLAETIEQDAQTEDALPLLAFALGELYQRYGQDDQHLTLEEYQRLGDQAAGFTPIENAVRQAAEDVIKRRRPSKEEMAALRDAFVGASALVRVKDGDFVRDRAPWLELPSASQELLTALINARLLVGGEQDGVRTVEVAHEALFRTWPLLVGWLEDEREFLTWRQRLVRGAGALR